jgi:cyclase
MQLTRIDHDITAFLRPEKGANSSLIRTLEGVVVIDTTSCGSDIQHLLDAAEVLASEVCLVINTHMHSDHTWGNQIFACPILAHRLCYEGMVSSLAGPWKIEAIEASIAERGESDPQWASEMRAKVTGLRVTLPTETFEQRHDLEVGGVQIQVIHCNGHTPGSSVVWLPETRTLFAGDLVFEGRYPFIGDADIPSLIDALGRLPELGAATTVPGHGLLCGDQEIRSLADYLSTTWLRTADHIAQGHSADEAASDPGYPRYAEGAADRYHATNIRVMYARLVEQHADDPTTG